MRNEFNKPEEYYHGAKVCVTGRIGIYKDKPQIEISSKNQITEMLKDKTDIDNEPK